MTEAAHEPAQRTSHEPVDITDKHFDGSKGEWVNDDPAPVTTESNDESPEAPGDRLAETRAEDHNENGTEGR
jgi:hypothetical protein